MNVSMFDENYRDAEWPPHIVEQVDDLRTRSETDLTRIDDLGRAYGFPEVPEQVSDLIDLLDALAWEPLGGDPAFVGQVHEHLTRTIGILDEMLAFDPTQGTPGAAHPDMIQRFSREITWFNSTVRPRCIRKDLYQQVTGYLDTKAEGDLKATITDTRKTLNEIKVLADKRLKDEKMIDSLVVNLTSASNKEASSTLSTHYASKGANHRRAGWWWLSAMAAAMIGAVVAACILKGSVADASMKSGELIAALSLEVLVLGLVLYLLRVAALQFRSHRHLAAVAENKDAALKTFGQLVDGREPEVQATMAAILAQSVFRNDDTGLTDGNSEPVTLPERVIVTATDRVTRDMAPNGN